MPTITTRTLQTPRLRVHARFAGPEDGVPVVFFHGNASTSRFWEETMLALPAGFRGIAPDLRGYGDTEDALIDATRGYGDWVDDFLALSSALGLTRYHAVGHSLGGAMLFSLIPAAGPALLSATLVNPGSPYGFGGSKGVDGALCHEDGAGSGGGVVNPEFARLMGEKDRGADNPMASPRVVMNTFYWKPPFRPSHEEELLSSLLGQRVGPDRYPGDSVPSPHWPGSAPGVHGPINAASPRYVGDSVARFLATSPKPPILWVRGADDQIVADASLFDVGTLGKLGAIPGWPGDDIHPPQPMVSQTRAVLARYAAEGGRFEEKVMEGTGHTPYVEKPAEFDALLAAFLQA